MQCFKQFIIVTLFHINTQVAKLDFAIKKVKVIRVIILIKCKQLKPSMVHTKLIRMCLVVLERCSKIFYHMWAWQPLP